MRRRTNTAVTIQAPNETMRDVIASNGRRPSVAPSSVMPDAKQIHEMIMSAALRQIATTPSGRAIVAAGMERELVELIRESAANVANPIVAAFEIAIDGE